MNYIVYDVCFNKAIFKVFKTKPREKLPLKLPNIINHPLTKPPRGHHSWAQYTEETVPPKLPPFLLT